MRKQLHLSFLSAGLFLATTGLFAQEIQYRVEKDILNVPTDHSQTFVYAGTFSQSSEDLTAAINAIRTAANTDPNQAATLLQNLFESGTRWGEVGQAPTTGPLSIYDWVSNPPIDPGPDAAGSKIYMLILSNSIESISANTRVGLLWASGVTVPGSETPTISIGFNSGTYNWDTAYMGASSGGKFSLEAIPEPATTCALIVTAAMAVAAVTRRRPGKAQH